MNIRKLCEIKYRETLVKLTKNRDLAASQEEDISSLKTVCLGLGPYRNLSTLTASLIAMHPNCQVLNHGGGRILDDSRLDFLRNYHDQTFENFVKYAIYVSQRGYRGHLGGSITLAHTFDQKEIRACYRKRYGEAVRKERIEVLFWKESQCIENHILDNKIDLGDLFEQNDKLRFLLQIRNPLDCAMSNTRMGGGYTRLFRNTKKQPSVEELLLAIIDELVFFSSLYQEFPGRFFAYFEHDFTAETLRKLAAFLQIDADKPWIEDALRVFRPRSFYEHSSELRQLYRHKVTESFADRPGLSEKLLRFCSASENAAELYFSTRQ